MANSNVSHEDFVLTEIKEEVIDEVGDLYCRLHDTAHMLPVLCNGDWACQ